MSASCSKTKTSAENLQESMQSARFENTTDLVQGPNGTAPVKILVIPSTGEDVQIIDMQDFEIINEQEKLININLPKPKQKWPRYVKYFKISVLLLIWIVCSCVLMAKHVTVRENHQVSIPKNTSKGYIISEIPSHDKLWVRLGGALLPPYYSNLSTHSLQVWVQFVILLNPLSNRTKFKDTNIVYVQNISSVWRVPLVSENLIGVVPEVRQKHEFKLTNFTIDPHTNCIIRVNMKTNLKTNLPLSLSYNVEPINMDDGIVYAALVLVLLYILIIFEVIHRTLAAMLISTMSIAILAALNARPSLEEVVSWIDIETLLLLFSMMTLVSIFSETGIFDYTAVLAYKLTNGREWPLINCLCFLTALLSCFLDNVTTGLLMTPITIRLCEVTKLDPIPVLISMIIFSNIGGAITPIGDPPNVIIASNPDVIKSGVNFSSFILHMGLGVILASIFTYLHLRCLYRNVRDFRSSEPQEVLELKREIAVWQRAAACMSSYSKDEEVVKETLKKRSTRLIGKLNTRTRTHMSQGDNYHSNLEDLQKRYPIRDKPLLIKSGCTLIFVITLFFLHSIPEIGRLGLGWTSLLGALLLLLLYDRGDIASVFSRVEWSTLLFFGALFVIMEALSKLGLIDWIGKQTQQVIMSVEQESRLAVAILLILWVSAIASAFVDNIPLTTMMIKVATVLADDAELQLPLQPLVWALSFGACFGGNGTLFGSSSNIICAGVAEQHGYRFTFMQFMKIGFPIMITSIVVVSFYLIIVHVVLQWH